MANDGHRDDPVAVAKRDAANADRIAAGKDADIIDTEADTLAKRRRQKNIVILGAGFDGKDFIALLVEFHGDLAVAVDLDEIRQLVAADRAARRREHHVEIFPRRLVLGQRHDRGDAFAGVPAAAC